MKKWESEKRKSWSMPAEEFKGHVATDGTLLGIAGKWGEHVVGQWCNWNIMKNWRPLHGMYGSMEAEFEVQRTIKRVELTAFFLPPQKK